MSDVGELYDGYKREQRRRRDKRLPERIAKVKSFNIPFRWLNEPYHMRFNINGKIIDYFPVHSVVKIKKGNRWITKNGIDTLRKELTTEG